MIYRVLTIFFFLFSFTAHAQILRDINYNYQYDPNGVFTFKWKVLKQDGSFRVAYSLQLTDTTQATNLALEFETRESISEKNGNAIAHSGNLTGSTDFQAEANQSIIVAKITVTTGTKPRVFLFHKPLPKSKSYLLVRGTAPVLSSYTKMNTPVSFSGFNPDKQVIISYYRESFPAAAPPFSSAQAKVAKTIKPDSIFTSGSTASLSFAQKGLYLVQHDTASAEGLAFRIENDYPKLGKLESLAPPLIYICTKQETEKLKTAGNDKKKFDQVILSFTGNEERARNFMRSYFRRVEMANQYFSSYKEGWKTDRGMIYIIFGVPDEVYLFDDREVWEYKTEKHKARFQFAKSPTVFDPENYVLIRDKKFTDIWYETVDLWRKARF